MFDLKFKWLPDTVVKEVNEKVEMLDRQDENSMFAYQKIVLNLAAGDMNPERLLMIHFFFGVCERAYSAKNMRNLGERVPESGMDTLAEDPVYGAVDSLPETDQGDRPHKRDMSLFCASTLASRQKRDGGKRNSVTFNPENSLRG